MLRSESVEQMIQVLVRFKDKYNRTYNVKEAHIEAIEEVAQNFQIRKQTVQDMCFRRLELSSIFLFRNLLETWMMGDSKPLFTLLKNYTPPYSHSEIKAILDEGETSSSSLKPQIPSSSRKHLQRLNENFSFSINPEDAKKLKVLSVMEGIPVSDWLQKVMIDVIETKYNAWLKSQR